MKAVNLLALRTCRLYLPGNIPGTYFCWGTAVAQWLRCYATNHKVAGSIPDGVIGIFHWHNPSDRTTALGSTQPLTKMSTRSISWGKCGQCVRPRTLPPSIAVVMKSGNLIFLEPSGPLQACNGTAYLFLLEAESTPGIQCGREDKVNVKFRWHHRKSKPWLSVFKHSASSNVPRSWTCRPHLYRWQY